MVWTNLLRSDMHFRDATYADDLPPPSSSQEPLVQASNCASEEVEVFVDALPQVPSRQLFYIPTGPRIPAVEERGFLTRSPDCKPTSELSCFLVSNYLWY
jgi:hypothetical protein